MKTSRLPFFGGPFIMSLSFFALILLTSVSAYAQKSAPQRDVSNAETNVRSMEAGSGAEKDSRTLFAEINEDFGRLRAINDELKDATGSPTLNYKSISDNSVEIKKRTARLKVNLAGLPKGDSEEKRPKPAVPADDAQMKSTLSSLNTLITSFLQNPVFSDMGTLDNHLAAKARRDLDSLIELSDVIKKGAEKLSKHSGQ